MTPTVDTKVPLNPLLIADDYMNYYCMYRYICIYRERDRDMVKENITTASHPPEIQERRPMLTLATEIITVLTWNIDEKRDCPFHPVIRSTFDINAVRFPGLYFVKFGMVRPPVAIVVENRLNEHCHRQREAKDRHIQL